MDEQQIVDMPVEYSVELAPSQSSDDSGFSGAVVAVAAVGGLVGGFILRKVVEPLMNKAKAVKEAHDKEAKDKEEYEAWKKAKAYEYSAEEMKNATSKSSTKK